MPFLSRDLSSLREPRNLYLGGTQSMPAPYGGLNLRDDITALKPNEARFLNNWLPDGGVCRIRPGSEDHGTGVGSGEVQTLATYYGKSSEKLIACGGGAIYDATSAGAASSKASGFTANRWSHDSYKNQLFLVNGVDAPQDYDGSSVAATIWTGSGLTITNLKTVRAVRDRMWFTENDEADVWYGSIGAITGALTKFSLSQVASGGKCIAIDSWSRDSGDGQDDLTVFVMSTGQIILYEGDPETTFTLVGKYGSSSSAHPVDEDAVFKVGGELIVITRAGFLPVSAAAGGVSLSMTSVDPWGKIAPLVESLAAKHSDKDGWRGIVSNGTVYVTVPTVNGSLSTQLVLNLKNGSWSTITGWNASSIAHFQGDLYFGSMSGGKVKKVTGKQDGTTNIVAQARSAFIVPENDLSTTNLYTAVRVKISAQGSLSGSLGVDTDYFEGSLVGPQTTLFGAVTTTSWGDGTKGNSIGGDWGDPWGSRAQPSNNWQTAVGEGRSVAVKLSAVSGAEMVTWFASDILWKPGGIK